MNLKKLFVSLLIFGFLTGGTAMANNVLNDKQKSIVEISSYTAAGDLEKL